MPTPVAPTAPSPLDVAVGLESAVYFVEALSELPWFADKADGLAELANTLKQARNDWEDRHDFDANDIEERSEARLRELGLFTDSGQYLIDPGYGRDIALLEAKLTKLAREVVGVEWSRETGAWAR